MESPDAGAAGLNSPDVATTASKLTQTIARLIAVLDGEVDGLYTSKPARLDSIYREKADLLADYAAGVSALRAATGNGLVELPAPLNDTLKTRSTELARAMERNISALAVAQEASQRVVDAIIEGVRQQRSQGATYAVGREGLPHLCEPDGKLTQAVTLDTRL